MTSPVAVEAAEPTPPTKFCWVGAPEIFSLGQACTFVTKAFGEQCYLVGSALERRDFRDVDVRMIMSDEKFVALFGSSASGQVVPFWSLICTSISEYLAKRTGLPVDFQIQKRSSVSEADWARTRDPLAMWINETPPWRDL